MRKIRFLIVLIIIALVGLALWKHASQPSSHDETVEAFMKPIHAMQQELEKRFPQLREEWEKLQEDIRSRAGELDPKILHPLQLFSSGAEIPSGSKTAASPQSKSGESDNTDLSQQMQKLSQKLKKINATDLARRLETLFQQVKQKIAPETRSATQ